MPACTRRLQIVESALRRRAAGDPLARRTTLAGVVTLLGLAMVAGMHPVAGQCGPAEPTTELAEGLLPARTDLARVVPAVAPATHPGDGGGRAWWNVWSEASTEDRVLWGMWSTHLNRENDIWQNDQILALIYRGLYAGTFRTTHGPQAYSLGVERSWAQGSAGPLFGMVGFRGGLVYGYDRRLGWVAEKYPVLPFAQPVLYARMGPITTDLTYTWVVISLTAGLRF